MMTTFNNTNNAKSAKFRKRALDPPMKRYANSADDDRLPKSLFFMKMPNRRKREIMMVTRT
ncbi:hypothetical protein ACFL3V_00830 [Nanoarchaeota archaeon]